MSAFGTNRTFRSRSAMSAFGGKADMMRPAPMSAFDPKRTSRCQQARQQDHQCGHPNARRHPALRLGVAETFTRPCTSSCTDSCRNRCAHGERNGGAKPRAPRRSDRIFGQALRRRKFDKLLEQGTRGSDTLTILEARCGYRLIQV